MKWRLWSVLYALLVSCMGVSVLTGAPSVEILHRLEKLNRLGSVLYIAAHPDDENTALLSYLSLKEKVDVGYLSLTRGSGGQNRIGPEKGDDLGIVRTQELLAARRIDGGRQFFTRALDFGYSRSLDETLEFWGEQEILSDIIRIIRTFRPDVVIVRFHPEDRRTHGHHQAATYLALKAFELAGDEKAFPEKLKETVPFQPKRILWDGYWWKNSPYQEEIERSNTVPLELSEFDPIRGESYREIAGRALAQHKSQGVVFSLDRRPFPARLVHLGGSPSKGNLFDDVDTKWTRLGGSIEIDRKLKSIREHYRIDAPHLSADGLLSLRKLIQGLTPSVWRARKLVEIELLILDSLGLFIEVRSKDALAVAGETVSLELEVANRSKERMGIRVLDIGLFDRGTWPLRRTVAVSTPTDTSFQIEGESVEKISLEVLFPNDVPLTRHYWLAKEGSLGRHEVGNDRLIGLAESPPSAVARLELEYKGERILFERSISHREVDVAQGEQRIPFFISPPVSLEPKISAPIFIRNGKPTAIDISIEALKDGICGELVVDALNSDWSVSVEPSPICVDKKGERAWATITVTPLKESPNDRLSIGFRDESGTWPYHLQRLDYPHIGRLEDLKNVSVKLISDPIEVPSVRVAYLHGAGDGVPEILQSLGVPVEIVKVEDLIDRSLGSEFDVIVYGIRAYDTIEGLERVHEQVMEFVKQGGTWICQYSTPFRSKSRFQSPFELKISRGRVTDETASMKWLHPEHPILNVPNELKESDFDGWVQERGLYFASEWSDDFLPLFEASDKGFPLEQGSLLVAQYGEGHYVYTGLSFFRQLPAGVPGATKLFLNLLSLGADE